jgi:hypothetical protein
MTENSQTRVLWILAAMVLFLFGLSVASQYGIEQLRAEVRPQEVLYVPSAKTLKRMSLGYTGLMADIYWTRAVQYFGWKHKNRAADYRLLYPLLDITTQLDPNLIVAYRFGAVFLAQNPPNGAGQPDKAVELVERGIQNNRGEWRLYYELGFLQAMERHDYIAAAKAFERGSEVPNAHPFLKVIAAAMAQHGGDLETARLLWRTTYDTTDDKMIKANAIRHLMALDVDETIPKLEEAVRKYRDKTGKQPSHWVELVASGYLKRIPTDPVGDPYKLLPDGTVQVQDPEALPFIGKGLPPGYEPKRRTLSLPPPGM